MALIRQSRPNSPEDDSMKHSTSDVDYSRNQSSISTHSSPSTSIAGKIASTLARSRLCHSLNSLNKSKQWSKFYVDNEKTDKVLEAVKQDHEVKTNPVHNKRRRTLLLMRRKNEPFVSLCRLSYLLTRGDDTSEAERITYVDYVDIDSNAAKAGVRAGDMIISINGKVVTDYSHEELISFISSCVWMRMIVMFENIRERIDLAVRSMQLQKLLDVKLEQLRFLEEQEQRLQEIENDGRFIVSYRL